MNGTLNSSAGAKGAAPPSPDRKGAKPLRRASSGEPEPARPKIAFSGEEGAFAHEACLRGFSDCAPLATASFEAALEAVKRGQAVGALIPIENRIAGRVPGVSEMIQASGLHVHARLSHPIRLHLLALPGAALGDIVEVASHPMALAQCRAWLSKAGLQARLEANTATAARKLAQGGDSSIAVIASRSAARIYGLQVLLRDLQDEEDNATVFAFVAPPGAGLR